MLADTAVMPIGARSLAVATGRCGQAILSQDIKEFGSAFRASFEAQVVMFPHIFNDEVKQLISEYRTRALGWKLSGAGGGCCLILVADKPVENVVHIIDRRESNSG